MIDEINQSPQHGLQQWIMKVEGKGQAGYNLRKTAISASAT
jgi:hypothetical protein